MALIARNQTVKVEYGVVHARASRYYVILLSSHLSDAYDLISGDEVKGEINYVKEKGQVYPELKGKEITFILDKMILLFDRLFISKTDWSTLFRERGLVSPSYKIDLRLTEAVRHQTKERVKLFTKKDVVVY